MAVICPVFCALTLLVVPIAAEDTKKGFGPFDIDFQQVTKCDDEGTKDIVLDNLEAKMTDKKTVVFSVDATTKITIDNNVTADAEIAMYKNGAYGPKTMKYPAGPICEAVQTYFRKSYQKLYKQLGIEGCPVAPNTWKITKFPLELEFPMNQLPYSKFRLDVSLNLGMKRLSCVRCLFATVPEGTVKY